MIVDKERILRVLSKISTQLLLVVMLTNISCNIFNSDNSTFSAGPILFISDESGTYQMYSMDANGENIKQLTSDKNFPIFEAKWSPDGEKIAVISDRNTKADNISPDRVIYIMDSDGANKYQLNSYLITVIDDSLGEVTYGSSFNLTWGNKSNELAFSRLMLPESTGNLDAFLININGLNEYRLTNSIELSEQIHSITDENLYGDVSDYSARDSNGVGIQFTQIFDMQRNGEIIKDWGEIGETWQWPIISMAQDKIAFVQVSSELNHDIFLLDLANDITTNITDGLCQYPRPVSWSNNDLQLLIHCSTENQIASKAFIINMSDFSYKEITPLINSSVIITSWRN